MARSTHQVKIRLRVKWKTRPRKVLETSMISGIATSRRLVCAGAAALCGLSTAAPLPAQSPADSRSQQQSVVIRMAIPAGPLSDAVAAFQAATKWQVLIPAGLESLSAKGFSDIVTAEEGLRRLLDGTGLTFDRTGARSVTLRISTKSDSVEVVERRPLASPRYTEPLRNIPQTISVIPREIIEQQGATTLADVMRNVPGLTITAGEGGVAAGDNLTLRGNSARNDIFVDGVRDLSPQSRDPFNLESVEVTKGPTSVVSGRGSAGGAINLNSKWPTLAKSFGGSFAAGNADTRRGTIDINMPLGRLGLGEHTGFRLNGLVHDSGVAARNVVENNRWGFAPSLTLGLGTPTRVSFSYYKLKQDNIPDYGIPWVPAANNALAAYRDQPAPVPRETFYGLRARDREVLNQDTLTIRAEHNFSDDFRLQTQLRAGESGRNSVTAAPRFASNDTTVINRNAPAWYAKDRIVDSQTDMVASFKTGAIHHNFVSGAAFTNERNTRIARTYPAATPTTLLNPDANAPYLGNIVVNPNTGRITGNTQSLWAFDTAKFGDHWEATGGIRGEHFAVDGVNTTPLVVSQNVRFASVRGGIIYKPRKNGSIYSSYGSSISPSLEGLSYNTSNTAIPPEKTYTYEVGSKWDVVGNRLLLTGALFRVAKDNARTPGLLPTDPPQVLAGRQVSQGLELSASGGITRRLRVLGAYTLIDARIRRSNTPAEVGRFFQNTPRNSASLWMTYTADRFTFGVGPRFMGRRFGNNINTRQVPGYESVDVMASYSVNRHLDVRFNLTNMTGAFFFDRLGGGHLIPAAGRYGLLTTNFRF